MQLHRERVIECHCTLLKLNLTHVGMRIHTNIRIIVYAQELKTNECTISFQSSACMLWVKPYIME